MVKSQEIQEWDKNILRDSVVSLLSDYQICHNQLNGQSGAQAERAFIHLFSNPRVKIVNIIGEQAREELISAEDYMVSLIEQFPEGLRIEADLSKISVGKPVYDRNNRYLIHARIHWVASGISAGRVKSVSGRSIFQIAFFSNDTGIFDFSVYGMEPARERQSFLTGSFAAAGTGFSNPVVREDERMTLGKGTGYTGSLRFSYYFSDHFGAGTGAGFTRYSGTLGIDRFDAAFGLDPNMRDVRVQNTLWCAEIPLFLSIRTDPERKLVVSMNVGASMEFRTFEEASSSAVNATTGNSLSGVFTDTGWISGLTRWNIGVQSRVGLNYRLTRRFGVLLEAGIRQGLTPLDNISRSDYATYRYQGQFNPLWAAPDKTVNQALFAGFGVTVKLNKE